MRGRANELDAIVKYIAVSWRFLGDMWRETHGATQSAARHGDLDGFVPREAVYHTLWEEVLGVQGPTQDLQEDRNGWRRKAISVDEVGAGIVILIVES
jgi:hypothetical protein